MRSALGQLEAGPAGACGCPPARQRHDGHRGTDLTLPDRGHQHDIVILT